MNYAIEASFITHFTSNGRSISFFRAAFLTSTFFGWFFRVLFSKQPIFMHYSIRYDNIASKLVLVQLLDRIDVGQCKEHKCHGWR